MLGRLLPRAIGASLSNYKILSSGYGQYRTIKNWECVDAAGDPVPWYTYPAIEYIKQLDFSDKTIFEFGSGNSTRFWGSRCKQLVSVEDDPKWYGKIKPLLSANVEYYLLEQRQQYVESINTSTKAYDVIIIDGSHRYECAAQSLGKLSDEGFIILDNSDWHDKTSQLLRDANLLEVDMFGFGPINSYTWATSFYFRRNVKLIPACKRQPTHGVGGLTHCEL